ncbi:putative aldehyde reductase [Mycena albidolilacea]|uniref:Aldehyde reductase n=1 Tax=Mycena albidolilacea TaxID=1033008 RepID=A0AAD7E6M5_9AGAR|nr:putative aldehyde reductase [Mycena albidolilacea]
MACIYGDLEVWMGKTSASKQFTIDSKVPGGFGPGTSTGEGILQHTKETVEHLQVKSVNVYYIHAPDPSPDLEDQFEGINKMYKAGYFKRFGLSSFKVADVQCVYDIAKAKGYPLPAVYQANYSVVARKVETELMPMLHKLGIVFYIYSPIAEGLLTKTAQQLHEGGESAGCFATGHAMQGLYGSLYNKPSYYKVLDLWEEAAKEAGCTKVELAYCWAAFNSVVDPKYGNTVLFGASKLSQILETLALLKRSSIGEVAKAKINKIWKIVEDKVLLDNYHQ